MTWWTPRGKNHPQGAPVVPGEAFHRLIIKNDPVRSPGFQRGGQGDSRVDLGMHLHDQAKLVRGGCQLQPAHIGTMGKAGRRFEHSPLEFVQQGLGRKGLPTGFGPKQLDRCQKNQH